MYITLDVYSWNRAPCNGHVTSAATGTSSGMRNSGTHGKQMQSSGHGPQRIIPPRPSAIDRRANSSATRIRTSGGAGHPSGVSSGVSWFLASVRFRAECCGGPAVPRQRKHWAIAMSGRIVRFATLAEHVPDRYRHAIRYFGLLAPRSKGRTSAALFALLGQKKRPRPPWLSWANSLRKHFGVDPLVDSNGLSMHWVGRLN